MTKNESNFTGLLTQDTLIRTYQDLIIEIGEDHEREGLVKTPERASKAIRYLTEGYNQNIETVLNNAIFTENTNELVVVKDIEFFSLCEHHILPFWGVCHIGYIPNGKVLGLSKLARIVDVFARRLQVQERLTKEIADCIQEYINPDGVVVTMKAQHMCMMMRGVQKQNSSTITKAATGIFQDSELEINKFFHLLET
ncbi:GTP cyclohydrolase I FolE [Bacillus weihaiensis]|uniref:GTP cyclohydrolase I FolE n=1 Tax=Bacillus weihaiensis TaxID=1547283 RepID=UPI002354E0AF|nr:GTP cyclohydrolase I FolE [Bacillus weihaiensis]